MDAPMKQAVAIIIGALLIASALVFQAYQHRYEVAGAMGGLFVRLDSRTGQLSACALWTGEGSNVLDEAISGSIIKTLSSAGYSQQEISDHMKEQVGQMLCSPNR